MLKRKENSFRGSRQRRQFRLCYHSVSTSSFRNINLIPFRHPAIPRKDLFKQIDSPVSNYCSHGTFLHFSLQSSHLNICYYYQDLH
eukprot:GSChrysophyteH1.ASY1.ANO1.1237.1 assembled CDS